MINGLNIALTIIIFILSAKYKKQKRTAENWKNTAKTINAILNDR